MGRALFPVRHLPFSRTTSLHWRVDTASERMSQESAHPKNEEYNARHFTDHDHDNDQTGRRGRASALEARHDHPYQRRHRRRHGDFADYFLATGPAPARTRAVQPLRGHRAQHALSVAGPSHALYRRAASASTIRRSVASSTPPTGRRGSSPRDIDTGAIILTGEAIRRDNARAIADLFAAQRGTFVCATAGHNFEALLAAHGSGAVALSAETRVPSS